MTSHKTIKTLLIGSLALAPLAGCETIQENPRTSGATIGAAGGVAAGALIGGSHNRILGALLGGALGAGGGYLIGSQLGKANSRDEAVRANEYAQTHPVTVEQARNAYTADINGDGFVTMDEVVAMERAGLNDDEMLRRLQRTGQFFELTPDQERYLRDNGVSQRVVVAMRDINQDVRQQAYTRYGTPPPPPDQPIGNPPPPPRY